MRLAALFVCAVTLAGIAPAVDKASLEGRVVHAQTGEPVRKANLTLRGASSRGSALSAVSDASGHFLIREIDPGTYKLTAERTGFLRQEYGARGARSSGVSITLSDGQNSRDLEFRLTPQGVITGKVFDEDGEPLQRATLSSWIVSGKALGGSSASAGSATTNDIGEFRLAGLAPGRYLLSASMRRSSFRGEQVMRGDGGGQEDFVPTYYPGVADRASAATIEVPPGQEVSGIRIQLRKSPVYHVRGKVAAPPAPNGRFFRVMLVSRQPGAGSTTSFGSGTVQKDGGFDITGVLPGSYYAIAMGGEGRLRVVGKLPVDIGSGNLDNLVIPEGQPVSLNGSMRVEGDDKTSVRSATVELIPESIAAFQTPAARVKDDGTFQIADVWPDNYQLSFHPPDGTYVRSVRMGSEEKLGKPLDLTNTEGALAVEVILSTKVGGVDGIVNAKDKPAAGATVTLVPEPAALERAYLLKTVTADQNGRFSFTSVAPGDYRVYAWDDPPRPSSRDIEFAKPYESQSAKVTVKENSRETAELTPVKEE